MVVYCFAPRLTRRGSTGKWRNISAVCISPHPPTRALRPGDGRFRRASQPWHTPGKTQSWPGCSGAKTPEIRFVSAEQLSRRHLYEFPAQQELREKRGYVYTVDSNVSLMSDTGLMLIYFGSDPPQWGNAAASSPTNSTALRSRDSLTPPLKKSRGNIAGSSL